MKYQETFYLYTYCRASFGFLGHKFKHRYDPVPGSGDLKNTPRDYYRHMKTTHERRWYFAHKEYVRAKRNAANLPNYWDDYPISERQRCWKRTKKKRQWS